MIETQDLNRRIQELMEQLHAKLGLRGKSLRVRLGRAGRRLPKRLHRAGQVILDAEQKVAHPKLALLVDPHPVEAAFAEFKVHLAEIDPVDRRKGKLLGWLAGVVFNLILVIVLLLAVLRWQGLI